MRLLDIETCEIQEIKGASECRDALAKCAIVSHRWGGHELSFQQYEERMKSSNYTSPKFDDPGDTSFRSEGESEGFLKLARARLKARRQQPTQPREDLKYIWMDTCRINKQELGELEKAITSTFRWYSSAKVCYAYLPDVSALQNGFQELEEDEKGRVTKENHQPKTPQDILNSVRHVDSVNGRRTILEMHHTIKRDCRTFVMGQLAKDLARTSSSEEDPSVYLKTFFSRSAIHCYNQSC